MSQVQFAPTVSDDIPCAHRMAAAIETKTVVVSL